MPEWHQSQPGQLLRWTLSIRQRLLGRISQLLFEDLCTGGQFEQRWTNTPTQPGEARLQSLWLAAQIKGRGSGGGDIGPFPSCL